MKGVIKMRLDEKKLKIEICNQNLKQVDLMKKADLSRVTLSKIYNGGSCSTETAFKIAKALGVEVKTLVKE
jgi:plasmid maintenance system antidote protein VapI